MTFVNLYSVLACHSQDFPNTLPLVNSNGTAVDALLTVTSSRLNSTRAWPRSVMAYTSRSDWSFRLACVVSKFEELPKPSLKPTSTACSGRYDQSVENAVELTPRTRLLKIVDARLSRRSMKSV